MKDNDKKQKDLEQIMDAYENGQLKAHVSISHIKDQKDRFLISSFTNGTTLDDLIKLCFYLEDTVMSLRNYINAHLDSLNDKENKLNLC